MTTPPPAGPNATGQWKLLDATQRRVFGVLIEKAKTTPAGYPMTVNAIVAGCNQKSNREPLMTLDDTDVGNALGELQTLGAVSEIDWLGRAVKFKHHAYEWLGVNKPELAVMTELLLRGEQSLGDLRGRAARMEPIADLGELKPIVAGLLQRGLMIELTAAGRGQMVSHNLYLAHEFAELKVHSAGHGPQAAPSEHPPAIVAPAVARATPDEFAALSSQIAELHAEVAQLRARVGELEAKLHSATG
ncbi:MAG: DUF480 domain-containing protein [Candidatus Eisenbacteria bacterium]